MDIKKLLKVISAYDDYSSLYWDDNLNFFILCNDCVSHGADGEQICNDADIEWLHQCYKDSAENGALLYCARKRNKTPMQSCFKYIAENERCLFIF